MKINLSTGFREVNNFSSRSFTAFANPCIISLKKCGADSVLTMLEIKLQLNAGETKIWLRGDYVFSDVLRHVPVVLDTFLTSFLFWGTMYHFEHSGALLNHSLGNI